MWGYKALHVTLGEEAITPEGALLPHDQQKGALAGTWWGDVMGKKQHGFVEGNYSS